MHVFHHAFKVKDIASTYQFYHEVLQCKIGRQSESWIDFDFFGHQLSAHVSENMPPLDYCGTVDQVQVPIPHFGCVLDQNTFKKVQKALEIHDIKFIVPPQTRYKGKQGEQQTMFVLDYSNNPIEFKCFKNDAELFNP
ncbi:VOC family protein [Flavobacterium sp. ASW18X]|uniref:VOC family protein n=1 Tax=Flavobacterium sp. ASW18X TaxID=2572595 RepID=UPI0010AE7329|nr:VOC family protein [Flavobacterium sp. ASW18X]TKD60519.1 dioxygenase [Flavobacterium sp. ASW18X]